MKKIIVRRYDGPLYYAHIEGSRGEGYGHNTPGAAVKEVIDSLYRVGNDKLVILVEISER
jgi:hypothetical protein